MHRVTTPDGIEIAVHDLGGQGDPLLMAHGTGFHGMVWEPVARPLTDHFHCWALDFRGHGDSGVAPDMSDWLGFGTDVLAVVDALGLHGAYGVAHSMGSAGLLMAEQRAPGTFSGLYLYEPAMADPAVPLGEGSTQAVEGALRRREVFESRAAARSHYASKPPLDSFDPEVLTAYVEHGFTDLPDGTVRLKCRPVNESAVFRGFPNAHVYDHLGSVHCPITLADGELTLEQRDSRGNQLANLLSDARVIVLPGLDHFGPMQQPEQVAASVIETLAAAPRG